MQHHSRMLMALYEAMLTVAAQPQADTADQLWLREFARRLITEFAVLKEAEDMAAQSEADTPPQKLAA